MSCIYFLSFSWNYGYHVVVGARCRETISTDVELDDRSLQTNVTTYYLVPLCHRDWTNLVWHFTFVAVPAYRELVGQHILDEGEYSASGYQVPTCSFYFMRSSISTFSQSTIRLFLEYVPLSGKHMCTLLWGVRYSRHYRNDPGFVPLFGTTYGYASI